MKNLPIRVLIAMKTKTIIMESEMEEEIIQTVWFQNLTAEEQIEVLDSDYIKLLTKCYNGVTYLQ